MIPQASAFPTNAPDMGLGLDNPVHLAIVLVIVLLLFGAKRLPEIGRSLGEGMRGFKDSITGAADRSPLPEIDAPTTPATNRAGNPQGSPPHKS
jgi:sec-independent protein translocase protein TatA